MREISRVKLKASQPGKVDVVTATRILKRRKEARSSLLNFAKAVVPDFDLNWHHIELCRTLEQVEAGEIKRLMVFMPPRHSKSLICTQVFPCWLLGLHPKLEIMQCGYADSLAIKHSRSARNIFVSPEYKTLFKGVSHRPERASQSRIPVNKQTAHEWETTAGGGYYARGIESGITGRGYNVGIIDDPVKDRAAAESLRLRDSVWDWFRADFFSRKMPNNAIILIMTRWHEDDLAGRIMDAVESGEMADDVWRVLSFPAIAEADEPHRKKGEALWPAWFDLDSLRETERTQGSYNWNALYQQHPTAREGNLFKVDMIQWHDSLEKWPEVLPWVRCWDPASTKKERAKDDPDFTAGAKVGVYIDRDGPACYVPDVRFGQWSFAERNAIIVETAREDGPDVPVIIESVGAYKEVAQAVARDIARELGGGWSVRASVPLVDKVVRAGPLEICIENGRCHILRGEWTNVLASQLAGFPMAAHDDLVDAMTAGYNASRDKATAGRRSRPDPSTRTPLQSIKAVKGY